MPIVSVYIPQIGEGLQEARVVAFLKQPGDTIKRDEPIFQMETDKAVMDVESPVEGTLIAWNAQPDDVLAIGAAIATVETTISAAESAAPIAGAPVPGAPVPGAPVPGALVPGAPAAGAGAGLLSVTIPQIGEGLQEARVVAFLKQPGDFVKRDEPIYQMETDKAVMDVESPYEGVLIAWVVAVDDVVPIGAEIATMSGGTSVGNSPQVSPPNIGSPANSSSAAVAASSTAVVSGIQSIPPRTRAYAKEKGVSETDLCNLVPAGSKLMPDDIDRHLAQPSTQTQGTQKAAPASTHIHTDRQIPGKQRVLNSRMVRSNSLVVPGTMTLVVAWEPIESYRAKLKAAGGDFQPSLFTMFAFACAKAMAQFPAFRSCLLGDDTIRTFDHVSLGIAVGLPGDELVIATVDKAETLSWTEFAAKCRTQIDLARGGKDQAHEAVTVTLTNMQSFGLRQAVPVVVAPSMATIFLGETHFGLDASANPQRQANMTMTFDHRLANGVGAAEFLGAIRASVEGIGALLDTTTEQ